MSHSPVYHPYKFTTSCLEMSDTGCHKHNIDVWYQKISMSPDGLFQFAHPLPMIFCYREFFTVQCTLLHPGISMTFLLGAPYPLEIPNPWITRFNLFLYHRYCTCTVIKISRSLLKVQMLTKTQGGIFFTLDWLVTPHSLFYSLLFMRIFI